MLISSIEEQYEELKTELKICKIGGLFIALYRQQEVPKLIIELLRNDDELDGFLHFPLDVDEKKVAFPIFFEQTFEQTGKKSNIYHVLGIEENLSEKAAQEFLGYLQYARERLKAKPYSLVFWITPEFEKTLFFKAPDFHHWIFGTYDFSNITNDEIQSIKSSVNKESFDTNKIDKYLNKVIWQYEHWQNVKNNNETFLLEPMERNDLYTYYVQSYCIDKQGKEQLLDDLLDQFIKNEKQTFLTLLGDFGTGKSSFSIYYFIELAKKYLTDKTQRIPIFISLKDYKGILNIEEFMVKEFYEKFEIQINFSIFQNLALKGKFIFFIDGFDEMASLSDQAVTFKNLKELTKLSFENILFLTQSQDKPYQLNKVFLTSRTHYFLTEVQEQTILKADYTILYSNYATKSNYEITRIKLKEFNDEQIRKYVQKHTNNKEMTREYLKIIHDTYNLKDLSTRPLLLDMIIKTMPRLRDKKTINPVDLYREYTNIWIKRDDWRSQMTPEGKRQFMWEIASKMFELGGDFSLHYSKLNKPNAECLKSNFYKNSNDYYKYETTTCSFLNRDTEGNYKFIHKSFMEYFVAELFYSHLKQNNIKALKYNALNREVEFFLKNIIILYKYKNELDGVDMSCRPYSNSNPKYSDRGYRLLFPIMGPYYTYYKSNSDTNNLNNSATDNLGIHWSLSEIDLSYGSLHLTNLSNADLSNANLSHTNLSNADLSNANLSNANLTHADLSNANLSNANLTHADLSNANLSDANLTHADLSNANLNNAHVNGCDVSGAKLGIGENLIPIYLSGSYQGYIRRNLQ